MLVLIVVAAAVAFSLFVASYQSQLTREEAATHARELESVRMINITVSPNGFNVYVTFVSADIQYMNITNYYLNGQSVQSWLYYPQGATPPPWMVPGKGCTFPANESCGLVSPLQQISVNLTAAGSVGTPIRLSLFTARSNEFSYTFVPPTAIAKVYFVQIGAGETVPVFDGSASFQPSEPDNATITSYDWTVLPQELTPTGVAYDADSGVVYVTDYRWANVTVVSDSNNSILTNVPVGAGPVGLAYDGATNEVFVANSGSHDVSVISAFSDTTAVRPIMVGQGPAGVAWDEGFKIFVANRGSDNVSVINTTSDSVVATVHVGTAPAAVAYDPTTKQVFVTNSGSANVTVIDDSGPRADQVVDNLSVGTMPEGIAFDDGTQQLFVANFASHNVSVISASAVSVHVVANVTVGTMPAGVAYDSASSQVFVTNSGSGNVTIINDSGSKADDTVANRTTGAAPDGITFDSLKREAFVANNGSSSLSVLSDRTDTVVAYGLRYVAQGEEFEEAYLLAGESYTVRLQVTNSDGIVGSASIVYEQP
jgi:YVTN family beta-propeller protein